MMARSRIGGPILPVALAVAALGSIAGSGMPRLALVSAGAAAVICLTRVRVAPLLALSLLSVVAVLSVVAPGAPNQPAQTPARNIMRTSRHHTVRARGEDSSTR